MQKLFCLHVFRQAGPPQSIDCLVVAAATPQKFIEVSSKLLLTFKLEMPCFKWCVHSLVGRHGSYDLCKMTKNECSLAFVINNEIYYEKHLHNRNVSIYEQWETTEERHFAPL